jgi:large conductance mechanosensitive channel
MSGFRKFILRGNLVDLAVAVVIGTQFSDLVKSFVDSFISPLLAGGQPNFSGLVLTIVKSRFTYGIFLTQVVSFLIAAAVMYFVIVLPVARLLRLFEKDAEVVEKDCPECAMKIPVKARRCPECTSDLVAASQRPGHVPDPRQGPR